MVVLTENQFKNSMTTLDITLKSVGLGALEAVHVLAGKFSAAAKESSEGEFKVELTEDEAKAFVQACDIAVKHVGLEAAEPAIELAKLFAPKQA